MGQVTSITQFDAPRLKLTSLILIPFHIDHPGSVRLNPMRICAIDCPPLLLHPLSFVAVRGDGQLPQVSSRSQRSLVISAADTCIVFSKAIVCFLHLSRPVLNVPSAW